ncbi:hypothetical protein DAMDJJ_04505 [Cupriavidus necator]
MILRGTPTLEMKRAKSRSPLQQNGVPPAMPEYAGYKIVYEVIALPRSKWAILIEIMRRTDGQILARRHNPFPNQQFDTKLEALEHVNRYVEALLATHEPDGKVRRIA